MQKVDMKAKPIRFHNTKFPYKYLHETMVFFSYYCITLGFQQMKEV